MDIIKILKSRYSTKAFDKNRKLDQQQIEKIKELLILSPSSTNIQPWHFIIALSDHAKRRVAKATEGFYAFNEHKILDAAAVVLFCTRITAQKDYLNHLSDKEQLDGRYSTQEQRIQNHAGRLAFANLHLNEYKDQQHWFEKQTYLNAGNFLLAVAALGLDAVPMEGCNLKILNEEFALINKGFTASFLISVGYRAEGDFNAKLQKSRLPERELIEVL